MIKKYILIALLTSNSASASELDAIEQQFYCAFFSYTLLKTEIAGGKLTLPDEIQQLDRVGGHLGKARELVLQKHGSRMSNYAYYRNKVLNIFLEDIKKIEKIELKDKNNWVRDNAFKCGKLFAHLFYTEEDIKKAKEGGKELNKLLENIKDKE